MTFSKRWVWWLGAMLVGAPLACMDLDGYHLDGGVVARGGGPATGTGGRAGAPRGGSSGTGTCANEVFTLYNDAADYEAYSSGCDATLTKYSWAYVTDGTTSGWVYGGGSTTRSLPFGSQMTVETQCCWFDLLDCFALSTICDFYGDPQMCECDPVVTHRLTADTCPGEDVVICS